MSGGVFYFDMILLSFAYAVPLRFLLVRYEKRDGACRLPSSRYLSLVAAIHGVADGDGVPIDGV